MEQKVIKVGNSLAVTIPKSFVKKIKLKAGDMIVVHQAHQLETITVQTRKAERKTPGLTLDFFYKLEKFNKEYAGALRELAKR